MLNQVDVNKKVVPTVPKKVTPIRMIKQKNVFDFLVNNNIFSYYKLSKR